jgi:predicted negative regulator of RcsB-dependent stress response
MSNASRLIASLHIAEESFDAAIEAKEWYNASRWRSIIESERGELELTLRMEDPATTMADVRYFEGFKYV